MSPCHPFLLFILSAIEEIFSLFLLWLVCSILHTHRVTSIIHSVLRNLIWKKSPSPLPHQDYKKRKKKNKGSSTMSGGINSNFLWILKSSLFFSTSKKLFASFAGHITSSASLQSRKSNISISTRPRVYRNIYSPMENG